MRCRATRTVPGRLFAMARELPQAGTERPDPGARAFRPDDTRIGWPAQSDPQHRHGSRAPGAREPLDALARRLEVGRSGPPRVAHHAPKFVPELSWRMAPTPQTGTCRGRNRLLPAAHPVSRPAIPGLRVGCLLTRPSEPHFPLYFGPR